MAALTPLEVAQRLNVSPKTVGNLLRAGKLVGFKVGKIWRIHETDLEQFSKPVVKVH